MTKEQIQEFTLKITQENHSGLILVLCDMGMLYMKDALEAYPNSMEVYQKNVELSRRVMNELISCFNPADALGSRVIAILRFIYGKLVKSLVKQEPQELDRCGEMIDNLRVGFVRLHEIDTDGPVMKNTHQVYAGLTYGKGVLNESVQGVDYTRRGFKA